MSTVFTTGTSTERTHRFRSDRSRVDRPARLTLPRPSGDVGDFTLDERLLLAELSSVSDACFGKHQIITRDIREKIAVLNCGNGYPPLMNNYLIFPNVCTMDPTRIRVIPLSDNP